MKNKLQTNAQPMPKPLWMQSRTSETSAECCQSHGHHASSYYQFERWPYQRAADIEINGKYIPNESDAFK